ncbi:ATP-binding protein [Nevskia ramosa]|uniref:ATP-binding protein n=1 Tax=Nevskia ramosa TaxID=64002 RepID=UPI0003B74F1F|nr:ATP-binding protein [Nevskia ramosa]
MIFTILRELTHSELGMFHEYRRSGLEKSRQRAINFDGDVVDRVFPAAQDSQRIYITCRCLEDATSVVTQEQWLKKQDKNWRLEGYCPNSAWYAFVKPGVLFAMVVDSTITPANAAWVVIPIDHPARSAIVNHGEAARLNKSAMIALHGEEANHCRGILAEHFPSLFASPPGGPTRVSSGEEDDDEAAPDPLGLFNILARAGHSLPSAVADLVDNSLSKDAEEINISFPNPNEGGRWMCIHDDGVGMNVAQLRNAMRIGHQRDYDHADLGKFGYGLKGAAWSQADTLTVVSKTVDSEATQLTWDKYHLAKTRRWALLSDPVDGRYAKAVELGSSGTAVLLTNMRPPVEKFRGRGLDPYAQERAAVCRHLELVFHRYLEGKVPGRRKVTINMNGVPLVPNDPMGHVLVRPHDSRTIELPSHQESGASAILTVRAYVTPHEAEFEAHHKSDTPEQLRTARDRLSLNGRANDAQGLYFYRLHRLIKWGGWEGLFTRDEHTKLLRVAIDFDRLADEHLQVDISKQLVRLPPAVSDKLLEILKTPRSDARNRYKPPAPTAGSVARGGTVPSTPNAPTSPAGTSPSPTPVSRPPAASTTPTRKERSPFRLVESGTLPWERKNGFAGEQVEVSQRIPELVALIQTLDKDANAKAALSEFLRVLEIAGVMSVLVGSPDAG